MNAARKIVRNSSGERVKLTNQEFRIAKYCERQLNSLGYEISITTLTEVVKLISEQKFFELPPADYVPVRVGQGAWSSNLVTYRSFMIGDSWETGLINLAGQNDRLATADAGVDSLTVKVFNWAKSNYWSIFELQEAARSGNWDLISAKEESRKKNWDLGVQRIAFLGINGLNGTGGSAFGLLNQPTVNVNTTVITSAISGLAPSALKTFCQLVVEAYRTNCNRTAWPTHFVVPESDFNGMASQSSPDFPIKSTLELLEETFKLITRRPDFKIMPCAYGDVPYNGGTNASQVYALYNYDEKSIRMDIPVPYTNTLANSLNNFQFTNTGYGQTTPVLAYRPLEALYFTCPPPSPFV